eukprot:5701526-Pyramimonas_sp.AAC.1
MQAARHNIKDAMQTHLQEACEEAIMFPETATEPQTKPGDIKPCTIDHEIWEQVSTMGRPMELAEEMRTIGGKMIIRGGQLLQSENQLTEKYGAWATK